MVEFSGERLTPAAPMMRRAAPRQMGPGSRGEGPFPGPQRRPGGPGDRHRQERPGSGRRRRLRFSSGFFETSFDVP